MSRQTTIQSCVTVAALTVAAIALVRSNSQPILLNATAAHGSQHISVATVPIDSGVEAIVVLDHVTLELTGYIMNPYTGKFFAGYYTQLADEFGVKQGKIPEFTLIGGHVDFRQFTGNNRPADGVIYVAEALSGKMIAYSMPWNAAFRSNPPAVAKAPFIPLDYTSIRTFPVPQP
ncbi:MAG: hypothetical protein H6823_14655 [Planctomycetaceae bacterium]|nr:hypothetical protein [Planctomycetaceae bacterium]